MKELLSLLIRVAGSPNEIIALTYDEYQKLLYDMEKNIPFKSELKHEYLKEVKRYLEEITFTRSLKAIKGLKIPEQTVDRTLLSYMQRLFTLYKDIISGKILLNRKGKTIVRVTRETLLNEGLIGEETIPTSLSKNDIVNISLEKAIPLYLLGLISFE